MLILLPPSETKRSGGTRRSLDVGVLALPQLRAEREAVLAALVELSTDEETAMRVLGLGERQRGEVAVNAAIAESPTMPAIDRYTGVLYDALDAKSLDAAARRWLGTSVLIHSAPFGPVGALDRIPAYRLAAGASLPGLAPLRRVWAAAVSNALAAESPRFVLDLRSEAYVALGPIPLSLDSVYVRVVTATESGAVRALNHFNKHAKGALVRALAQDRPRIGSTAGFERWARSAGWELRRASSGTVELHA